MKTEKVPGSYSLYLKIAVICGGAAASIVLILRGLLYSQFWGGLGLVFLMTSAVSLLAVLGSEHTRRISEKPEEPHRPLPDTLQVRRGA